MFRKCTETKHLPLSFVFVPRKNNSKSNPPVLSDLGSFQQRDAFETKRNIYLKAVEFVVKSMLRESI